MTLRFVPIEEAEEYEAKRCPAGWSIIADHRIAAPKMLVEGLLPYEALVFIGGQSGAGKTFIAVDLSVALASRTPFFGRSVRELVGVAYIAAEGGAQIGNRLFASADARSVKIDSLPIAWRGDAPLLRNASDINAVAVQLQQMDAFLRARYGVRLGVAILDTVAATFDLEDEDNNSEEG
jgi:RecA-family ATPase